jgi:hypothetical protein
VPFGRTVTICRVLCYLFSVVGLLFYFFKKTFVLKSNRMHFIDEVALHREEEAELDFNKRLEELAFGGVPIGSRTRKLNESQEAPYSADESDGDADGDADGLSPGSSEHDTPPQMGMDVDDDDYDSDMDGI